MDYVRIIAEFHPSVYVSCSGDPSVYSNLIWEAGDPLPDEATLEASSLALTKLDQIQAFTEATQAKVLGGFTSDALGSANAYDSEQLDQLNMLSTFSNMAAGDTCQFPVHLIVDGVKQQKAFAKHTYDQMKQLVADWQTFKVALLEQFSIKREAVNQATTEADVLAITLD